jgi:ribosomal protein S6
MLPVKSMIHYNFRANAELRQNFVAKIQAMPNVVRHRVIATEACGISGNMNSTKNQENTK